MAALTTMLPLRRAWAMKLMALVPRKLPQLLLTAKRLLSGSAEPLRAHCGEEGGFVELVRANGTWMNFSHPDGCLAARSAPA